MPNNTARSEQIPWHHRLATALQPYDGSASPLKLLETTTPHYKRRLTRAIGYPVTIDELASQYRDVASRANTPEFQQSKRRVALVIGESALLAALPLIPEETIIVADYWKNMLWFMRQYRDISRTAANATDWQERIINRVNRYSDHPAPGANATFMHGSWSHQIGDWEAAGMTHPQHDAAHFARSQQAARDKAIIPYEMDVMDPHATTRLGNLLLANQATITFLNLTNVIQYSGRPSHETLDPIANLPLADNLPILASELHAPLRPETDGLDLLGALGPFYGLDQIRVHYGD